MKLFLKIKYDGEAFHGFQTQPDKRCVQSTLTEKLSELFSAPVNVTGCSRTDAGVHALGFVVSVEPREKAEPCEKWCRIPVSKIVRASCNIMPDDLAIVAAAQVPDSLHPRYGVSGKEYVYRIYDSFIPDPFRCRRTYFYGKSISDEAVERMNSASKYFIGKHDFTSFMAQGSKITDPVRTVFDANVVRVSDEVVFTVSADGFLYNMVRIMTGTLLEAAEGRIDPDNMERIINDRSRTSAGQTVPPEGLYLNRVFYPENIEWTAT